MKKILGGLIMVFFLLMVGEVKALSFKEGEFLNGIVSRKKQILPELMNDME